ncbi:ubiquitin carboxyl-terminal hydrolase 32 isoform X3 [Phyllopteryx taeniolatus]|uniref:ubiquitin carboxyl-terminal hydrolase 32 isoform X3 n=1 Tax=Phyllopteryx taeniolatus TaxID=161469 RepID=UPI002AD2B687|nr:ubiquitin carboxyl-terminal hydrolase 32 isoform X3 [Phyllopteryx taeniolatus]
MYFLRLLRKHGLPQELLRQFYTAVIESVLYSSITVWFGAATKKDKLRLQRTIKTAERIVGTPLPTLEDLHVARTKTRACKILLDPPHPGHQLFQLLPSDLFSLFTSDPGGYAAREDVEAVLQVLDGELPASLGKCFNKGDKVNYEHFRDWLLENKEAFTLSRWLLSGVCAILTDDSDTPTFYQTLSGVTHLAESDIIDLEKHYWLLKAQSRTGRFDLETFIPLVSPPIHISLCEGLFFAFDENRDNHIDFKEISCGLSACCRGPIAERQKFCFKVFDVDRDGVLSHDELSDMVLVLLEVWKDNRIDMVPELYNNVSDIAKGILKVHDTTKLGYLTLEDYQIWSVQNALAHEFLNLLFQVCHIVLGLTPATSEEEGQIIRGWLERENRLGLQPGHSWFLISVQWWQQWKNYTNYDQPSILNSLQTLKSTATLAADRSDELEGIIHASERSTDGLAHAETAKIAHGHISFQAAQRPGAIDNQDLVAIDSIKVPTLTMEGGRLKRSLRNHRHFEIVPELVWRALYHWYGANLNLPRPVILNSNTGQAELELFPCYLLFLRHESATPSSQSNIWSNIGNVPPPSVPLTRVLVYTACFSRKASIKDIHLFVSHRLRIKEETIRLWLYNSENYLTLLDDEDHTLESLQIQDEQQLVIEIRNKDMSWPEEMSLITNSSKMERHKVPTEKGATGLSNLGNTCFMNSSIQCVSNTRPLTDYFITGGHFYELNRSNPIGMQGHMAKCYGDLVMELWNGTQKNVAPLKLRWTIAKYAPRFNGFQQQDSQELLAFLLDGLHEDLNRVHEKPYVELKDSDGRPDWEVASEAWENHLRRNRSIVVDLFHGQLKSQVKCKTCGHISSRFDPFNFLSLPLPMDRSMHLEITVIKLDGSTPVCYGLRLNMDEKYTGLKKLLSVMCKLKPEQILLAEVHGAKIKNFSQDHQKVRLTVSSFLCAFEIPVPGSPASKPPVNSITSNGHQENDPVLIWNEWPPSAVCNPEASLAKGFLNVQNILGNGSAVTGYIIAMHRKMMRTELYFLSSQKNRPSLFGMPLIVPCTVHTTKKNLYDAVWMQVSRLVSPLPPQDSSNHAQDCDDSMGYQYPFTLRAVDKDGTSCAFCPWYRFCSGCTISCTDERASLSNAYISVDWDPTALHLRYQTSLERVFEEHCSVEMSHQTQAEPISLDSCLNAFTSEEELGEDELYYCSKCETHRLATKKLDLWRLPPILIVHFKRFHFVNGCWIKSQKIVKFPRENFDPSNFLVSRDLELCFPHSYTSPALSREPPPCQNSSTSANPKACGGGYEPICQHPPQMNRRLRLSNSNENLEESAEAESQDYTPQDDTAGGDEFGLRSEHLLESVSAYSLKASTRHTDVIRIHDLTTNCSTESRKRKGFDSIYSLYAISCHTGIMGGGHYVTYAKNPNGKWYYYNDSSCKEVHFEEIDTDSAYMLFYEQQGVNYSQFLPKMDGQKMADTSGIDEDFESDYKKYCVIQ